VCHPEEWDDRYVLPIPRAPLTLRDVVTSEQE
jgi:hypothetical protein